MPAQVMDTIPTEQRDTVRQGIELLLSELERLTARHQNSLSLEQIENVSCIQEFLREGIAS